MMYREIVSYLKNSLKLAAKAIYESFDESHNNIFFHKPSGSPENGMTREVSLDFNKMIQSLPKSSTINKNQEIENIFFISYNNTKKISLIEKCYELYGITNFKIVSRNYHPWDWMGKIIPLLKFLEKKETSLSEYIILTDANDVFLINYPSDIIHKFEQYKTDILFCNTVADWPPNKDYKRFELQCYLSHPFHSHLSAGGYIGRKSFIINCLKEIVLAYNHKKQWAFYNNRFDDQLAWRALHRKYYPRIKVDYKSLIFKRFDAFRHLD